TSLQRGVFQAALGCDVLRMHLMLQGVEGRTNHVVGVRGTRRLGDDVMNAERFEDGAHRTTGDDTGTSLGRTQQNLACAVTAVDVVMQRTAVAQRYEDQIALGAFGGLADGFWNFTCLAVTETDATLLVADDDEGCKAETTAALDHLGDAVDRDQLIDEFAVALFAVLAIVATSSFLCHCPFPFSFPGAIGRLQSDPNTDRVR